MVFSYNCNIYVCFVENILFFYFENIDMQLVK